MADNLSTFGERVVPGVPSGAEPLLTPKDPTVTINDSKGSQIFPFKDTRV